MRAVNVRVTSKHPFLSQSDRIGDKLSVSQTRSLLIPRGVFVSEQSSDHEDTDTVSTFSPVYSQRAKRCCFYGPTENYSLTLFDEHKNSVFLESQGVDAILATRVEQHRSDLYPGLFICPFLIDCLLMNLLLSRNSAVLRQGAASHRSAVPHSPSVYFL